VASVESWGLAGVLLAGVVLWALISPRRPKAPPSATPEQVAAIDKILDESFGYTVHWEDDGTATLVSTTRKWLVVTTSGSVEQYTRLARRSRGRRRR
jgi:hypothetical protein